MPLTEPATVEASLERLLFSRVRGIGGIALKLSPNVKGTPDRLVLLPVGRMYLVELKTTTGRLSPAQKIWHERAAAIGVHVVTLHGAQAISDWVSQVANEQISAPEEDDPCTVARALRAHASRVRSLMPAGLVSKSTVLADLEDYAARYERQEA